MSDTLGQLLAVTIDREVRARAAMRKCKADALLR